MKATHLAIGPLGIYVLHNARIRQTSQFGECIAADDYGFIGDDDKTVQWNSGGGLWPTEFYRLVCL